jgi:type IV secretion system protein VirB2
LQGTRGGRRNDYLCELRRYSAGIEIRSVAAGGAAAHFCAFTTISGKVQKIAPRDASSRAEVHGQRRGAMQRRSVWGIGLALLVLAGEVFAQASPFSTGTTAFQGSFLAILTPVAVIAVMALGLAAWFNRISWGWAVAGVVGIVLVFGAPQIVAWVSGLFGV